MKFASRYLDLRFRCSIEKSIKGIFQKHKKAGRGISADNKNFSQRAFHSFRRGKRKIEDFKVRADSLRVRSFYSASENVTFPPLALSASSKPAVSLTEPKSV